jgi:hypothetical protein
MKHCQTDLGIRSPVAHLNPSTPPSQQGSVELAVLDKLVRTYQPIESAEIRTFIARLTGET